jgi:CBS domain-containing protein
VVEIFQDDVARFRVLMATQTKHNPLAELDAGRIPTLDALQLHNSTVYRWNRPCYGISNGKPHLRIECRSIPAGPSIIDEIANAAFWIGMVKGGAAEFGDLESRMEFDDAKANFLAASRHGLKAVLQWFDGETVSVTELINDRLLPLAESGLQQTGVAEADIHRLLGVIRARVAAGRTGANWAMRSLDGLKGLGTRSERMAALTAAMVHRQREGTPIHEWAPAELGEAGGWKLNYLRVEQYMITDLYTVVEDELIELVAFVMDKYKVRHVLVEDAEHRLTGLVSYRTLLRLLAQGGATDADLTQPVKTIMTRNLITVTPETTTVDAIQLMRSKRVPILPVVKGGKLVGVVAESDFMPIASQLLEEKLKED